MITYSIHNIQKADYFRGNFYKLSCIQIRSTNSKIYDQGLPLRVRVYDNDNSLSPFSIRIAPNGRELTALFTVDAFTLFTGNVNVEFGYGLGTTYKFENVDIAAITTSHPSYDFAALTADNFWLSNL